MKFNEFYFLYCGFIIYSIISFMLNLNTFLELNTNYKLKTYSLIAGISIFTSFFLSYMLFKKLSIKNKFILIYILIGFFNYSGLLILFINDNKTINTIYYIIVFFCKLFLIVYFSALNMSYSTLLGYKCYQNYLIGLSLSLLINYGLMTILNYLVLDPTIIFSIIHFSLYIGFYFVLKKFVYNIKNIKLKSEIKFEFNKIWNFIDTFLSIFILKSIFNCLFPNVINLLNFNPITKKSKLSFIGLILETLSILGKSLPKNFLFLNKFVVYLLTIFCFILLFMFMLFYTYNINIIFIIDIKLYILCISGIVLGYLEILILAERESVTNNDNDKKFLGLYNMYFNKLGVSFGLLCSYLIIN